MDKVREIKKSFRMYMNGVTSQSLSDKGCTYKISWGVSRQHLQEMAAVYGKDRDLAMELWKSQVRECRLLATMIMPPEDMPMNMARQWMEESHTRELKEMLVFNLLRHVPYGFSLALEWLDSDDALYKECGFNLAGRMFAERKGVDSEQMESYLRHARECIASDSLLIVRSAVNSLQKFGDVSEECRVMADGILEERGI